MNKGEFRKAMIDNGDNQKTVAAALGLAQSALSNRLNGKVDFRMEEIKIIRDRFKLTPEQTITIFFNEKVS